MVTFINLRGKPVTLQRTRMLYPRIAISRMSTDVLNSTATIYLCSANGEMLRFVGFELPQSVSSVLIFRAYTGAYSVCLASETDQFESEPSLQFPEPCSRLIIMPASVASAPAAAIGISLSNRSRIRSTACRRVGLTAVCGDVQIIRWRKLDSSADQLHESQRGIRGAIVCDSRHACSVELRLYRRLVPGRRPPSRGSTSTQRVGVNLPYSSSG